MRTGEVMGIVQNVAARVQAWGAGSVLGVRLMCGLAVGPAMGLASGPAIGFAVGFAVGPAIGLAVGFAVPLEAQILEESQDSEIRFEVRVPGDRFIPVYVRLPSGYSSSKRWPLMFAMHGGPTGSAEQAERGARNMIQVWAEAAEDAGWIVASPAMVYTVARDGRTRDRLPYEIFHPEEARAVIDAVRDRFSVDPDRVVSTGISLGSNFSIAFGAAHPDWFSAIVPVSTEGESREHVLRNLASVPAYVLEGSQDQNIRGVSGPRALNDILTAFGYDLVYREFGDRAHEGFREHYPDVLRWLESRPRSRAPREVLRVPHSGIMPVSRRVHWIETDTRQALVRARATGRGAIEITARWAGSVVLTLPHDLVNLDAPIEIRVNGEQVFSGTVQRLPNTGPETTAQFGDGEPTDLGRVTVSVPATHASTAAGAALSEEMAAAHPEGQLSFWEMYAVRALEERFPSPGFDGVEVPLPPGVAPMAPEQVAIRVTAVDRAGPAARAGLAAGDLLLTVGGEPFFEQRGGVMGLHAWLMRELRETSRDYPMVLQRGDRRLELTARYQLGPYRPPSP